LYPGFYFTIKTGGAMFNERNPIPKMPDNSKAGLTVHLDQKEPEEPFVVTVFLKKPRKPADEKTHDSDAISLAASGKLRLTIGEKGFVEIFAENSKEFSQGESGQEVDE
jgi:quercetin dioxygenase-like cupin family protein